MHSIGRWMFLYASRIFIQNIIKVQLSVPSEAYPYTIHNRETHAQFKQEIEIYTHYARKLESTFNFSSIPAICHPVLIRPQLQDERTSTVGEDYGSDDKHAWHVPSKHVLLSL